MLNEIVKGNSQQLQKNQLLTGQRGRPKKPSYGKTWKIDGEMKAYLTSPDTVMNQMGMTLAQRATMFHRKFPQVHITEQYLG